MKTVAAISFRDNHSISMDVDAVSHIELSAPIRLENGQWCCEMLVRSAYGTIALQLTADRADQLQVVPQGLE